MRLVVDTSVWVELITGTSLGHALARKVPTRSDCVMPTIVQLDLAKWLHREFDQARADRVLAFTAKCDVVPLDTAIALQAADLCRLHKLPTADAIVYATARRQEVDLLTCDAHFEGLDGVTYVAKAAPARR